MSEISIWRNDGVIEMVLSPKALVALVTTFVGSHSSWDCNFMAEGIDAIKHEDIEQYADGSEKITKTIDFLLKQVGKSHTIEGKNRIHLSDSFAGMYESTMHPVELSALGEDAGVLLRRYKDVLTEDLAKDANILMEVWGALDKANQALVRPTERMAALGNVQEATV